MDPDWVDVFPIEHGDVPASYVSLSEGSKLGFGRRKNRLPNDGLMVIYHMVQGKKSR